MPTTPVLPMPVLTSKPSAESSLATIAAVRTFHESKLGILMDVLENGHQPVRVGLGILSHG